MQVDQDKLNAFMGKFVADIGAAAHGVTVLIGEKLGLFKAMAAGGPMTPAELATKAGCAERYVREWLAAQAASGFAEYAPATGKYHLSPEQAFALADESSPAYVPGAYYVLSSLWKDEPRIAESVQSGKGMGWHEHHADLFVGTEKFFRPGYVANLVGSWLPALDGVEARLQSGGTIADVGCGHGVTSVLMAQAYPKSRITGFDFHRPSIERARAAAEAAGVADRCTFEVAPAKGFPGKDYDLVTFFDCLHDMGDPTGAAAHVYKSLKPGGTWMIVEPFAHDSTEQNLNPVGRVFYAASLCVCCPASLSQEVGAALGAQAGEARISDVVRKGGFKKVRRAAETPFNMVLEARK